MKKNIFIILLFMYCILFISCNKPAEESEQVDKLNINTENNEIILLDVFSSRLGKYNLEKMSFKPFYNEGNTFQYSFLDGIHMDYYTSGDSIHNNYRILQVKSSKLETIARVKKNEKVFPFAVNDNTLYFLIIKELKSGYESRIVKLDNNEFVDIFATKEKICTGIFIDNILYYTIYLESNQQLDLYKCNLSKEQEGSLVKENIETDEMYNCGGELLLSNNEFIHNNEMKYKKKMFNTFLKNGKYLLQYDADHSQDMRYYLTNLSTGENQSKKMQMVNYQLEGNILTLYGIDSIERIELQ